MGLMEISIMLHVGLVLFLLWTLSQFKLCHPVAYFVSLIYLYLVHEMYVTRLRKKLEFEEKRQQFRRRVILQILFFSSFFALLFKFLKNIDLC
ncbi:hypothetical protein ES319_D01G039800v1 [Gossypium barbadense]|uniref:Uncharacterized protein n=1 Tax=Gossypium barbadense TaxID=3634 RepID=A0A5J5SK55_GOSBA|nr:hypothetical protein ES319_D01G039800v1 [Gossypium barbadense]